jgi:hypothetical protein
MVSLTIVKYVRIYNLNNRSYQSCSIRETHNSLASYVAYPLLTCTRK